MSLFSKLHGGSNENHNQLTPKMFFTEHNVNGYMSMSGLVDYLKSLNASNLASTELTFEYFKNRIRLNSLPIMKLDKAGAHYLWANFQMVNSTQGMKIMIAERLLDFIKDYQQGKITIDFTLEDLLNVAQDGQSSNESDNQEAA